MRTAQISGDTTFTGFADAVNANVNSEVCMDDDGVVVFLEIPPVPELDCTTKPKRKPQGLVFEYTGQDCSASNNTQEKKAKCEDKASLAGGDVEVFYKGKDRKKVGIDPTGEVVGVGELVLLDAFDRKKLHSKSKIEIRRGGVTLQKLEIHTSCSKPLQVGDQFGSLILREFIPEIKK